MMEPMTAGVDGTEVERNFHEVIVDLTNELLDDYYESHPSSSAFGADYDAPEGEANGSYFVGRENGADGAEDDIGFDYFYRRFRDLETRREESEYIYGKYGWMDINDLADETNLLRQVFEEAVEDGHLNDGALGRFDAATEALADGLRSVREEYDLGDIANLIRNHEIDTLRSLLGHGEEESRTIWQLLFSKDEDGDHMENPVTVPVISEVDRLMFVRTDRYYYDDHEGGKWYAYGAVIGYDDTPERFFVHRLPSDPDLRDEETEWTIDLVKEKMGFDDNLHEVGENMPHGRRVRLQGDLAVIRHDYDDALAEQTRREFDSIRSEHGSEYVEEFAEAHPSYRETEGVHTYTHRVNVRVTVHDTDGLKQLQDELDIDEEAVREEQERRDISRLTAKRRNEIVTDLLEDRIYRWCCDRAGVSEGEMRADAERAATDSFEDEQPQINAVIGNHTLLMSNGVRHPRGRRFGNDETREALVVPDEATLFVIHDEHDDKQLTLGPGVYEFRFLQGYEDEWWMSGN